MIVDDIVQRRILDINSGGPLYLRDLSTVSIASVHAPTKTAYRQSRGSVVEKRVVRPGSRRDLRCGDVDVDACAPSESQPRAILESVLGFVLDRVRVSCYRNPP